jgi:hypothetical protein
MIRYNTKRYWGYSTDEKPIDSQIGDRFLELDTNNEYVFNNYNEWTLIGSGNYPFLRNQTNPFKTDIIKVHESIFNPCDLDVLSTSIFIVDDFACYYVLGDLNNDGSIIVDGTLKIDGALTTTGPITGSGVIE